MRAAAKLGELAESRGEVASVLESADEGVRETAGGGAGGTGDGGTFCGEPEVAEEVDDGGGAEDVGRAEGEVADGADVLFELAGDAGALAGVVGVVGAGGEFVDEEGPSVRRNISTTRRPSREIWSAMAVASSVA